MFDTIRSTVEAFTKMRFDPWQGLGNTLLVGEGNLSFAESLLRLPPTAITHITATTFEKEKDLIEGTVVTVRNLRRHGAIVLHGVDATKLEDNIKSCHFDTIIFQFPNVGSRDAKHGHNPNHVMIRKFLRSAAPYLAPSGKILMSVVDNPHYQGAFQFDEAAAFSGYKTPESYPFDPSFFPGYSHTNTNDDESSLDEHNKFATWVFRLKK